MATLSALRAGIEVLLFPLHALGRWFRLERHGFGARDRYADACAGGPAVDGVGLQRPDQYAARANFRCLEIEIDLAALIDVRCHRALDGDRLACIRKSQLFGPYEDVNAIAGAGPGEWLSGNGYPCCA